MIDIDTLVGRLMDLESKYYDLQERYHHLINEYEALKETHEQADSSGHLDIEEKTS
jgi:predicted nuclease with TOPRIM domain